MAKKRSTKKKPAGKPAGSKTHAVEFPWIEEKLRHLAVPLGELQPDPQNAREHDEANLKAIAASLKKYGQVQAVVVNSRNQQVVIGNGRLEAARRLGWSHLAAIQRAMTPAQQRSLAIADNRSGELATWDQGVLDAQLAILETEEPELFEDLYLADLLSENVEEPGEPPAVEVTSETCELVVACADKMDRKNLWERMKTEGRRCRLLTI